MLPWRPIVRASFAIFVLMHALAHTVLLVRGELEYPPSTLSAAIAVNAFTVAVIALFAAGMGILGSRAFRKHLRALMGIGLAASVVALTLGWNQSSWWGLALDAALVGFFAAAKNMAVLPVPEPAGTWHGIRRARLDWRGGGMCARGVCRHRRGDLAVA
jgi:hypothetical protein